MIYRLEAVVYHCGNTMDSGHYVAQVRARENNKWYMCDDHMVTDKGTHMSDPPGFKVALMRYALQPEGTKQHDGPNRNGGQPLNENEEAIDMDGVSRDEGLSQVTDSSDSEPSQHQNEHVNGGQHLNANEEAISMEGVSLPESVGDGQHGRANAQSQHRAHISIVERHTKYLRRSIAASLSALQTPPPIYPFTHYHFGLQPDEVQELLHLGKLSEAS